jgi:adenylate cyclase
MQVNLAARLESMCKQYGVEILISGYMRALAGEAFLARRVDRVVAYGRSSTTDIYELVAMQGTALPEQVCPPL